MKVSQNKSRYASSLKTNQQAPINGNQITGIIASLNCPVIETINESIVAPLNLPVNKTEVINECLIARLNLPVNEAITEIKSNIVD